MIKVDNTGATTVGVIIHVGRLHGDHLWIEVIHGFSGGGAPSGGEVRGQSRVVVSHSTTPVPGNDSQRIDAAICFGRWPSVLIII